jgi:hypothetical protein
MSSEPIPAAATDTSERGLLIAVLVMVVLGVTAMLFIS